MYCELRTRCFDEDNAGCTEAYNTRCLGEESIRWFDEENTMC